MLLKGMDKQNRRHTKRLAVNIRVSVRRLDKKAHRMLSAYLLEAKDMTQKGFFVRIQKPLPIGTELKIELTLPDLPDPVVLDSRVAWIAKRSQVGYYPGMGIAITKIKRGDNKKIREFLKNKFRNYRQALELKKMYHQLKDMGGRLYDMEQSHTQALHFKKVIDHTIQEIDNIAHILDREVWEIKRL
jgi:Tfp pilus assembly protein PilZ